MRGIRLAQGLEWIARHQDAPPVLREFLKASSGAEEEVTQREREALEREVTRFAELVQHAQARAEAEVRLRQEADRRRVAEETAAVQARRSAKRSRKLSYALGALLLIAAAAAWLARQQQLTAQSQTLAAQAEQLIGRDRPAALDLAIRSWRTARTTEANLAVAHAFPQLLATLEDHTGRVIHTAFSPDGQRIVTASDDALQVSPAELRFAGVILQVRAETVDAQDALENGSQQADQHFAAACRRHRIHHVPCRHESPEKSFIAVAPPARLIDI